MLLRSLLLPGVLVPGGFALLASLVALALARSAGDHLASPQALRRVPGTLPIAAAFAAAYVAVSGWPRFPPVEATQRLFFVVVALALVIALWSLRRDAHRLGRILTPISLTIALLLMLESQLRHVWQGPEGPFWILGLVLFGWLVVLATARHLTAASTLRALEPGESATPEPNGFWRGWRDAVMRLALIGGTAIAIGLTGSARLAQITGAIAVGALVHEFIVRLLGQRPWRASDSLVLALPVFGLLVAAHFYSALSALPAALLGLAWVLLFATGHPGRQGAFGWRAFIPLAALALALALAAAEFRAKAEDDPYAGYEDYVRATEPVLPDQLGGSARRAGSGGSGLLASSRR